MSQWEISLVKSSMHWIDSVCYRVLVELSNRDVSLCPVFFHYNSVWLLIFLIQLEFEKVYFVKISPSCVGLPLSHLKRYKKKSFKKQANKFWLLHPRAYNSTTSIAKPFMFWAHYRWFQTITFLILTKPAVTIKMVAIF